MPEKLLFYFASTDVWNHGNIRVCSRWVCCSYSWEGADGSLLARVWDHIWTTLGICENTVKSNDFYLQHHLNTSFERDRILLHMENYSEYFLTSNDVALVLWEGGKLRGEVPIWCWSQCNKVLSCLSLFTSRIWDPLEILSLTSLEYMQMLKYSFTKQLSL